MRPDLPSVLRTAPRGPLAFAVSAAVLSVASVLALELSARAPVPGALALVGLVATADHLARLRRLGPVDRLAMVVGGAIVTIVLTGLVLGSTSIGLRTGTWVVALAVVSLAGLVLSGLVGGRSTAETRDAATGGRRTAVALLALAPWLAGAAVVLVLAVRLSADALSEADTPPLQMYLGARDGTEVEVVVEAGTGTSPLEVRTSRQGNEISYPLFTVGADGSHVTKVSLPTSGRFVITLSYPDQNKPLRTLVLDR